MKPCVERVTVLWADADGKLAEEVTDGEDLSVTEASKATDGLRHPMRTVGTRLHLSDGSVTKMPFDDFADILPDRSGVLVIFKEGSFRKSDGTDVFPRPNNAAIFNADGSLRFQLMLNDPHAYAIKYLHERRVSAASRNLMSVLVSMSATAPPENVFLVDPENPNVVNGLRSVRW